MTTTLEKTESFDAEYTARGAKLVEEFQGIRIYELAPTYKAMCEARQKSLGNGGILAIVFDVSQTGLTAQTAEEIATIGHNHEFTRTHYGNSPSAIQVRLSLDGKGLAGLNAYDIERYVPGTPTEDRAKRQIQPGETIAVQINSTGDLEKSTMIALAEILKRARV